MENKKAFIPSVFTFFNLFLGFFSIAKSFEGDFRVAAWLIIICALCDAMDGKLARWTGLESKFGFELDSLSDMVSFGVAPAMLAYVGILHRLDLWGLLISFLFVFGGAYRLARYNVQNAEEEKHIYMGLTIPISAMTLSSFWLFESSANLRPGVPEWLILIFILSILMMSTLPYGWPRLVFDEGWFKKTLSIFILLSVLAFLAVLPEKSLFPFFVLFILIGIGRWMASNIRGETEWTEFFFFIKRND
jgi:CDP-diacylglycerol---serine O-phosphatidyltransferase